MHRVTGAGYLLGHTQGCLRGTRKEVLQQIQCWLADEKDPPIFWLNGPAGTGKSTVAQTFAQTSFADGELGASFFCSQDFEDRRDTHRIFPTLASQLARRYPEFRHGLLPVLSANTEIAQESLCSQLEKLIIGPFKAIPIRTLIIIDALHKCEGEEPASAILSVLSRYVDQIPRVKFFITGRPEPRIRTGFRLELLRPITEVLKFHDVERSSSGADIKLFLETRLTEIAKTRSDCDFGESWPKSCDIDVLCKKSNGLFIYASTVVKFVASNDGLPTERLNFITSLPERTSRGGKSGIDLLYTKVLERSFRDAGSDTQEHHSNFRLVAGALLLVFYPLSRKTFSGLFKNRGTPSCISNTLHPIRSLLLVPDNEDDLIRPFHQSFLDFLTDPARCNDERFFIDPPVHHADLLFSCLDLMGEKLMKNICDLNGCPLLSEVKDLPDRKKASVGEALEYACRFWAKHLSEVPSSGPHVERVKAAIDEFFTTRLLFWIEALSLTGYLDLGVHALRDVDGWYLSVSCVGHLSNHALMCVQTGDSCEWTNDSYHLILSSFDGIRDYPTDIYRHVLPFFPSSSWLHKWYTSESLREVEVIKGCPETWGTCPRRVSFSYKPVALAHGKDIVAVGLISGNIIILDAITGSRRSVLSGHTEGILSLALTPDGTLLVSGSFDDTIRLWDIQTGRVVKTFHGRAHTLSISPDAITIASGSVSHICLWSVGTGECNHTMNVTPAPGGVTSLHFLSAVPGRLVSTSGSLVQQWDANGSETGPTAYGHHIAFSPDGKQFVLCTNGHPAVHDTVPGTIVANLHSPGRLFGLCCFSPDGRFVAGVAGATIYFWDVTGTPRLIESSIPYRSNISSLIFSFSLISMHHDRMIRFQRVDGGSPDSSSGNTKSTVPPRANITYTALQAEENFAISVDSTGTIERWDLSTGLPETLLQIPRREEVVGARLANSTLTVVHYGSSFSSGWGVSTWDVEVGERLERKPLSGDLSALDPTANPDLGISKDGSTFFVVDTAYIRTWSISTGESTGSLFYRAYTDLPVSVHLDGPLIWLGLWIYGRAETWAWDLRNLKLPPIDSSNIPDRLRLACVQDVGGARGDTGKTGLIDANSRIEVFRLPGGFAYPSRVVWDGRYLFAVYRTGEVLILDFLHMARP